MERRGRERVRERREGAGEERQGESEGEVRQREINDRSKIKKGEMEGERGKEECMQICKHIRCTCIAPYKTQKSGRKEIRWVLYCLCIATHVVCSNTYTCT